MIWVVGGTSTSREISNTLKKNGIEHIVSVATEYGKKLYRDAEVVVGRFDRSEMTEFIDKKGIGLVIDSTHPYAVEVSENAIEACKEAGIPHIRFERRMCNYGSGKKFKTYEEAVEYLKGKEGNVLVTTGSNNLGQFKGEDLSRYYFRILPVVASIKKAIDEGISPKNILGLQGPFTAEFNRGMLRNYDISHLITKESGAEGGEAEKVEACILEDVELVIIERPEVKFERIIYDIEELLKEVWGHLSLPGQRKRNRV